MLLQTVTLQFPESLYLMRLGSRPGIVVVIA